jgi:hypothetical protein
MKQSDLGKSLDPTAQSGTVQSHLMSYFVSDVIFHIFEYLQITDNNSISLAQFDYAVR